MSSDRNPGFAAALALSLTLFLAPTLGVPSELMLQDTLKSAVVAFGALTALFLLAWANRRPAPGQVLAWHWLVLLPLLLLLYALGSMTWSHAYLGGGEAIRWAIFAVLLWTGLNVLTSVQRLELLAQGIHWGAVMASLWTALQFWLNFGLFPQGPNPASTFINRNFFAEFAVCTLPFSLWLAANAQGRPQIVLRVLLASFNLVAVLMTGTRSALLAIGLLAMVLPYILYRYHAQFEFGRSWSRRQKLLALGVALATVAGLGSVPTTNPRLIDENLGRTALQRSFLRTASMAEKQEYTERSFSVRYKMWTATSRMVRANPLSGVGAGAWEVYIPLYQEAGSQLETDYYAHNEFLQLVAEYGLAAWLFLLLLLGYLCRAAWRTWKLGPADSAAAQAEAPLRALVLASLLALLLVSNAGFAWRMACTGALFALCLAALAASDIRLGWATAPTAAHNAKPRTWRPGLAGAVMGMAVAGVALAGYITRQAMLSEAALVGAIQLALAISESGQPNRPEYDVAKRRILDRVREGIAINPHYRKLTPMVADELARWGDWKDATWIWESVLASRPFVVVILGNIARGYTQMGDFERAKPFFERARALQPSAPAVRSFEVMDLVRSGREAEAAQLARRYLGEGNYDLDLVNNAYRVGMRQKDWPLALDALRRRIDGWPQVAIESWLLTGDIYANELHDPDQALQAYRAAWRLTPDSLRPKVRAKMPAGYAEKL
jgi:O-antigen ligase